MSQLTESTEWRFLERACRASARESAAELDHLLTVGDLDILALVGYAAHHKLLPLLASLLNMTSSPVLHPLLANLVPLHAANSHKARLLSTTTSALCRQLAAAGVQAAVTKGLVLHHSLYEADGTRYFTDVDLMIRPSDVVVATRVLAECGYQVGRYSRRDCIIIPLEPAELLVYKLSPDHLPKSTLLLNDPFVPAVTIDIAFSLTWASSPWNVPVEDALADRHTIVADTGELPALRDEFHFLFLILHLFREAWHEASMNKINLAQFRDIRAFAATLQPTAMRTAGELVREYQLDEPVGWVLGHLDRLFGEPSIAEQICQTQPDDSWLQTTSLRGGGLGTWAGDMRERLAMGHNVIVERKARQ
jgi:Uncharacterised nucleotidyltransferase